MRVFDNQELQKQIFESAKKHYVELDIEATQAIIDEVIKPLVEAELDQAYRTVERTLPTITAIEQTNQGEYGRGKIEITKAVRKALKEVR